MNIKIVTTVLELDVYGFSTIVSNGDYAGSAFKLMDRMWQTVRTNSLGNKGKNIWIYEQDNSVFAGLELEGRPKPDIILEHKNLSFAKYAYYKHIGPYNLIKQIGQAMNTEIKARGLEVTLPYVEIYGHWTNDENKLETELLMCVK